MIIAWQGIYGNGDYCQGFYSQNGIIKYAVITPVPASTIKVMGGTLRVSGMIGEKAIKALEGTKRISRN